MSYLGRITKVNFKFYKKIQKNIYLIFFRVYMKKYLICLKLYKLNKARNEQEIFNWLNENIILIYFISKIKLSN